MNRGYVKINHVIRFTSSHCFPMRQPLINSLRENNEQPFVENNSKRELVKANEKGNEDKMKIFMHFRQLCFLKYT